MEDKELEQILFEIGKKEIRPSQSLVDDTISFIKSRHIYYSILLSIISYTMVIVGIIILGSKYIGLEVTISLLYILYFIGCISSFGVIIASKNNSKGEINCEK